MTHLSIRQIADSWKEEKRPYVKRSTFAAYMLTLENHLLPYFGDMTELSEPTVQSFVLENSTQDFVSRPSKTFLSS